jgi:hypothetical protein
VHHLQTHLVRNILGLICWRRRQKIHIFVFRVDLQSKSPYTYTRDMASCTRERIATSRRVSWDGVGRDESERQRAESQWIVAARPLCHLQYPVAYLSRLQRILPTARSELRYKAATEMLLSRWLGQRHVPSGAEAPTAGRQSGGRRGRRFWPGF